MRRHRLLYTFIIILCYVIISNASEKKKKRGIKLLICPCNADKLCAKSKYGYAICDCWTHCNEECPAGFDRIDETTEYCKYGDTRSQCTTVIQCNNHHKTAKKHKDSNSKPKIDSIHESKKVNKSSTKNSTSSHNHLIGKTEGESDDSGYFRLSIVGFVLWQIASIGLGMLVCVIRNTFNKNTQIPYSNTVSVIVIHTK